MPRQPIFSEEQLNGAGGAGGGEGRKFKKKEKDCLFSVFSLLFISVGKSPLIFFFFLFKFNASWEHAVQDFGMGTSNEVGKGGKMRKWKL